MCFQQVPDRAEARPGKWGGVGLLFQSALSHESTLTALEVWIFMTLFYRAVSFVAVGCWLRALNGLLALYRFRWRIRLVLWVPDKTYGMLAA